MPGLRAAASMSRRQLVHVIGWALVLFAVTTWLLLLGAPAAMLLLAVVVIIGAALLSTSAVQ